MMSPVHDGARHAACEFVNGDERRGRGVEALLRRAAD
jgi:hypothetical protein